MLQPKRVKYRRPQDGRGNKGNAHRGTQLAFGSFGIKTLESKWIDSRQIEAARVALNRYMNRQGQVWIRIFPDKPITRKPADVRMGKVRVIQQDGLHLLHQVEFSSKLKELVSILQKKVFAFALRNFLLRLSLLLDVITIKTLNYEDCRN